LNTASGSCSSRFASNSSSGYAGRWNHKGVSLIYTASSLALSALEILASRRELPDDYGSVSVEIPDDLMVREMAIDELPPNWWSNPHPNETRDLGTAWAKELKTAVLSVPSAVIRRERNYILNPAHPGFARIDFGKPTRFVFDERLKRGTSKQKQSDRP
jgi:RES domain-containing protein